MKHKQKLARAALAYLIGGGMCCGFGCWLMMQLIEIQQSGIMDMPELDYADMLLIFPAFFKLTGSFIITPMFRILLIGDAVLLLTGILMLITGIVLLVRRHHIQKKEYHETAQKLEALLQEGALTDAEYAELKAQLDRER